MGQQAACTGACAEVPVHKSIQAPPIQTPPQQYNSIPGTSVHSCRLINTDSNSARKACDPSDPPPSYQPQKAHVFFDANWVPTAIGVYPEPNGGVMCPQSQPPWSAYRKPFMGYGILTLLDATTATWKAYNVDGGAAPGAVADQVTIKRTSDSPACRAKRAAVAI